MKIAVTGKGGVGKTTFAAVLARLYADEGQKVICADVDPDANLGLALGFSEEELAAIGLAVPQTRKLLGMLKDRGLTGLDTGAITPRDAAEAIAHALAAGGGNA